ncbi:hypothetical protein [Glycomyces harbinensis]|uniref:hypothetical protein n=1 Tax=Glycomyces harbinensis TaxID=58114 RepID=UPI00115F9D75|nr:hypothetical protein [Glycomyces harbinensis]
MHEPLDERRAPFAADELLRGPLRPVPLLSALNLHAQLQLADAVPARSLLGQVLERHAAPEVPNPLGCDQPDKFLSLLRMAYAR